MATVLPKSPPGFNSANVTGTVKSVTEYLRYLHENVDYLIGQLQKQDISIGETLSGLSVTLASMRSSISEIETEISTIESNYTSLEARVTALENA